ncbi:hypothetical protein ICW40_10320, partial [Actinotalea ferrariae]
TTRAALDAAPDAARWAADYTAGLTRAPRVDAEAVVEFAVLSIARSGAPDVDARLAALLADAIALAERLSGRSARTDAPTPTRVLAPAQARVRTVAAARG